MSFQISGLPLARFAPLFSMSDEALAAFQIVRRVADRKPGFPCRVSLRDADPGERVLLLNFAHQPAGTPYRSTHAIFVREAATEAVPQPGEIPEVIRLRLISARAFDTDDMMVDADVVHGRELEPVIERMFADERVAYLHLHNAKPGCYAARVDRA